MGLMKKLTSAIATASLVATMWAPAASAAFTPAGSQAACDNMMALDVVQGMPGADKCALNGEIDRAQMVTLIVRAFGKDSTAQLLKGAYSYADVPANHWASGYIALAKNMVEANGGSMGTSDTTFDPDAKLTPAQAVAFLMKFLGIKEDTTKAWPESFLSVAVAKGLVTKADADAIAPITVATRGMVFSLYDYAFNTYDLGGGKTFYTKYVDDKAPVLTLDTIEATTVADKVTITGKATDAVSVTVNGEKATLANGSFSYELALPELKEYNVNVVAADLAGNKTEKPLTITRTAGDAKSIAASDITVAAGETVSYTVAVKDANGNTISGAPVALEGTDVGTYADGKYTAPTTAGEYDVTFKSGDLTATAKVTVTAAKLDKVSVDGTASTFAVGSQQTFTAKGADAYGNEVALDNVTWSATGGVINAQGQFVASTSGNVTISATADGITGTLTGVAYGKATAIKLSTPAALVANGSSTTTVTVTAVDANGNTDLGFTGTASFLSNNSAIATIDGSASVTFTNGVATATLKAGSSVGATTISASVSGMSAATATATTTAQVLTSVETSVDPGTLAADGRSTATLRIKLLDQAGVRLLANNIPAGLQFTARTNNSSVASDAAISSHTYSSAEPWQFGGTITSGGSTGSATYTVSVTAPDAYKSLAVPSVTVNTTTVFAAYKLGIDAVADTTVGKSATVVVRAYDFNGNQTTGLGIGSVSLYDADDNTLLGSGNFSGGKASITVTKTEAGTYNLKATSTNLLQATGSVNFVAADAAALNLSSSPSVLNANGVAQATLKATVVDAYGNAVKTGSYAVKFVKTAGSPSATQAFSDTTVNTVDGVATATITASVNNNGTDTYTVSATGLVSKSISVSSKIMGAPAKLVDTSAASDLTKTVGDNVKVVVSVQDSASTLVSTDNDRNVTLTVKDADGNVAQTLNAATVNGKATFSFTQTTKGVYSAVATADGLTKTGTVNLTFNAGNATALKVSPSISTLAADGTSTTGLVVKVVDSYGNTTSTSSTVNLAFSSNNTNVGTVSTASYAAAGGITTSGTPSSSVTFNVTRLPGTATVTVSDVAGLLTSATADLTTIGVGDAVRANLSVSGTPAATPTNAVADDRSYSTVTVNVVDAAGNRLTSHNAVYAVLTVTGKAADGVTAINGNNIKYYASTTATSATAGTVTAGQVVFQGASFTNGEFKFYVTDAANDTLNYSVQLFDAASPYAAKFAPVTGSVAVSASKAKYLAFATPTVSAIRGNGNDVTVLKVVAKDAQGNVDVTASGTVYFKLQSGNDYATLLNTSSPILNGEATVSIQSKVTTDSGKLTILAWTDAKQSNGTDVLLKDGQAVAADSESNAISYASLITVDGKAPVIGSFTATGSSAASGYTNDTTPSLAVTATDDKTTGNTLGSGLNKAVFQYKLSSNNVWSDVYTETVFGGSTSADFGSSLTLGEGSYDFRVVAYDVAGNYAESSTLTRVIDTTAPTVSSAVYDAAAKTVTVTFSEAVAAGTDISKFTTNADFGTTATAAVSATDAKVVVITLDAADATVGAGSTLSSTAADLAGTASTSTGINIQ